MGDTCVSIEGFDPFKKIAYRVKSMLEVEDQNKTACSHLHHLGYNGDGFLIKVRRQAHNLIQRLSSITTEEARVTVLARSGISLPSIFFIVGPKCHRLMRFSRQGNAIQEDARGTGAAYQGEKLFACQKAKAQRRQGGCAEGGTEEARL
jgi:hypothetical protein